MVLIDKQTKIKTLVISLIKTQNVVSSEKPGFSLSMANTIIIVKLFLFTFL